MNPGELEVLIALVRSVHPKAVLEFGVNEGRTAKAILDNIPGIEHYQGIDVPLGYVPAKAVQANEVPAQPGHLVKSDPRFELILRQHGSHDLKVADLKLCDAAFIDGDHSFKGVMHDTALARRLVRGGGIIVWHDYHDLGTVDVRDVLDEFHKAGDDIVHVESTWLAFQLV
jgi:predicted O-methyltransferase YrrM